MSPQTITAPSAEVVEDLENLPIAEHYGHGGFIDIFSSKPDSAAPIVTGFWKVDDFEDGTDIFEAPCDETKFVISGESTWKDAQSGRILQVNAGSAIWLPKGSRTVLVQSKGLKTFYVEQTFRPAFSQPTPAEAWFAKVEEGLSTAMNDYVNKNAASRHRYEAALEHMPGGNTRSVLHYEPYPLAFKSGRGCFVTSLDGEEYLDFVSEYSAALFGHSNPTITEAIHQAIDNGINLGGPGEGEVELAGLIKARFPSIDKLRFCNSGTEANTMALALATNVTRRRKILAFENGYHGGWLSFGVNPSPSTIPHDFILGRFNDIEYTKTLLSDDIAAIIVEPMQGAGGSIPGTKEFLRFLRDSATKYGALLIFDEVVTSRLYLSGLQGYLGITPDITTLGKYVGGGPSFGAFGGRYDIMDALDPRNSTAMAHSGTFNNNIFTMAAGIAAAKLMTQDRVDKANRLGDKLRDGINSTMQRFGSPNISATGFGSMIGLHFAGPEPARLRDGLWFYLISKGVYIGKRGFMALNFAHEEEHIERFLLAFGDYVDALILLIEALINYIAIDITMKQFENPPAIVAVVVDKNKKDEDTLGKADDFLLSWRNGKVD
ncbi:hypothetical protein S40293_09207 [Stachybotrys chartarum IBT 40293]|nr:hypothetical protein S40293_09207 [Stachybotrys chartarum IBT 40293]